jgi:hypothetical protein
MAAGAIKLKRCAILAVFDNQLGHAKRLIALDRCLNIRIAEMALLIVKAWQHHRGRACAIGDGGQHMGFVGPEAWADIWIKSHDLARGFGAAQLGKECVDGILIGQNSKHRAPIGAPQPWSANS